MKRHPWLIPFSHDHQHGLAQALRLKRAAMGEKDMSLEHHVGDTLTFCYGELADHMHSEETHLLPHAVKHGYIEQDELDRIAKEHLRLRVLSSQLSTDPDNADIALDLATTLHDHIRWEERDLFEKMQERVETMGTDVEDDAAPNSDMPTPRPTAAVMEPQLKPGESDIILGTLTTVSKRMNASEVTDFAVLDCDTTYVIVDGSGSLSVDLFTREDSWNLEVGKSITLSRGAKRKIKAGDSGLAYTAIHMRHTNDAKQHRASWPQTTVS